MRDITGARRTDKWRKAGEEKQIEKNVNEVSKMRSMVRKSKGKVATAAAKEKERDKGGSSAANKKQQQVEAERREAARVKRMQELMRQVGTVLRQVNTLIPTLYPCSSLACKTSRYWLELNPAPCKLIVSFAGYKWSINDYKGYIYVRARVRVFN